MAIQEAVNTLKTAVSNTTIENPEVAVETFTFENATKEEAEAITAALETIGNLDSLLGVVTNIPGVDISNPLTEDGLGTHLSNVSGTTYDELEAMVGSDVVELIRALDDYYGITRS